MYAWNLTAKTIMSVKDWKKFFKKITTQEIIFGFYLKKIL